MGCLGRVVSVVVGLFVAFVVMGIVLDACDAGGDGSPPGPSPSQTEIPAESSPPAAVPPPSHPPPTPAPESPSAETSEPPPPVPSDTADDEGEVTPEAPPPTEDQYVYYDNCDEARAAGAAPLHRGDPGYRSGLDRDGDGMACEPYFGR